MPEYIERAAFRKQLIDRQITTAFFNNEQRYEIGCIIEMLDNAPVADVVEVETLRAWLYEIAMNNTKNYLCDACKEIISRLDGLRAFARGRKEDVNA